MQANVRRIIRTEVRFIKIKMRSMYNGILFF